MLARIGILNGLLRAGAPPPALSAPGSPLTAAPAAGQRCPALAGSQPAAVAGCRCEASRPAGRRRGDGPPAEGEESHATPAPRGEAERHGHRRRACRSLRGPPGGTLPSLSRSQRGPPGAERPADRAHLPYITPPAPGTRLSSVDSAAAVGKAGRLIAPESVIIGFGLFWQRGDRLPGVTP